MEWTDESIARLRSLWQEGLSTAEIGRRMQITKNAVVGKAHRLDLTARPSPIRKIEGAPTSSAGTVSPATPRRAPTPKPAAAVERPRPAAVAITRPASHPEPAPAPASTLPVLNNVRLLRPEMPNPVVARPAAPEPARPEPVPRRRGLTCCWPLGEPGTKGFHFCGGEPTPGKPYCAEHASLAYVKLRDRRDSVA